MPYLKRIVCLANSTKHHPGRCIAGKEILPDGRYGGWIRPVSERPEGEVLPNEFCYENYSAPKLLDIMDVPLLYPAPRDHQTENHVIDASKRWTHRGSIPHEHLTELRDNPKTLWINNHQTDTKEGADNSLTPAEAATQSYSLALIRPQDFVVSVASRTWEGVAKRKYLTRFQYNGESYALSLTDPAAIDTFKTKDLGEYGLENVLLCVSLTDPNLRETPARCYKLVAAIFRQQQLR